MFRFGFWSRRAPGLRGAPPSVLGQTVLVLGANSGEVLPPIQMQRFFTRRVDHDRWPDGTHNERARDARSRLRPHHYQQKFSQEVRRSQLFSRELDIFSSHIGPATWKRAGAVASRRNGTACLLCGGDQPVRKSNLICAFLFFAPNLSLLGICNIGTMSELP